MIIEDLITDEDRVAAYDRMFRNAKVELVQLIEWVALHRSVLKSPNEVIHEAEQNVARALKVVQHLDAKMKVLQHDKTAR